MAVRTKKVDVLALAKSSPGNPFATKRPGGGGSLEVPTPPQITNFVFEPTLGLEGDVAAGTPVAMISATPETVVFTLIDDAGGLLVLDGVDGDGKTILAVAEGATLPAGVHEVTIRATVGVVSADFTRTLTVAAVPYTYTVTPSSTSFSSTDLNQGDPIATFTSDDDRLTITAIVLDDDAGGVFEMNGLTLARGAAPAVDGAHEATLTFTFEADGESTPVTLAITFSAFSVG